jgi:hypothetical protein
MEEPQEQKNQEFRAVAHVKRSLLMRILGVLRLQDLMTLMMVAATVLSAVATWRSTQIAHQILRSAYRPYVGVREMKLDSSNPERLVVRIEILNFGSIPAENMVLNVSKTIDGRPFSDLGSVPDIALPIGVLTPSTPDYYNSFLPGGYLGAIVDGHSQFKVRVRTTYADASRNRYCYDETFAYFAPTARFSPFHGTGECP